jgi:hypothetical protein
MQWTSPGISKKKLKNKNEAELIKTFGAFGSPLLRSGQPEL